MKKRILISSCLLGLSCAYKVKNRVISSELNFILENYDTLPVCPEQVGGLPTPRPQQEILFNQFNEKNQRIVKNILDEEVTENFIIASQEVLKIAKLYNVKIFIGKSKSPSCGSTKIYDGNFNKTLIDGDGITAELLKKEGILVFSEQDLKDKIILAEIEKIML